jgi:hypothetical protein
MSMPTGKSVVTGFPSGPSMEARRHAPINFALSDAAGLVCAVLSAIKMVRIAKRIVVIVICQSSSG